MYALRSVKLPGWIGASIEATGNSLRSSDGRQRFAEGLVGVRVESKWGTVHDRYRFDPLVIIANPNFNLELLQANEAHLLASLAALSGEDAVTTPL